ncbi:thioredoxin family protein [Aquimarina pacifica]|uniref:thioredoxin family protein n=1 Tax=Aquimarina pacifica TaxID=1296415 RepID=UPI00046EB5EC|nr:thioredoxin family protein [Aquimarina pacifica]
MKKLSSIIIVMGLTITILTSCKNNQQSNTIEGKEELSSTTEMSDRKGPPSGAEKERPPKGKGPVQTKTLNEIGGYKIGETATDFSLKNVDETMVSLADIKNAKGYIITFTCNECPFSKMYEDRLIELHNNLAPKGYPVVAINPNHPEINGESFEDMQARAKEKAFPFVYLVDEGQKIYPQYGAVRTPHVFVLDKDRKVQYIGAIDDNARSSEEVKTNYIENAIMALEKGEQPDPNYTKAIGCTIKVKKA